MSAHLERGRLLLQQGRLEMAEAEFRQAAALDPDSPEPHTLLALTLADREEWKAADEEAKLAVGLAPDWAYAHFVHAHVLYKRHHLKEAQAAVREAIAYDPEESDAHALLSAILLDESRFADALKAAETALEFDPEHVGANNLRAMALTKLGRRAEAGATIDAALARDPENALSHANRGWTALESGDRERALVHFREALRLNPNDEWARQGILEALKAKRFVYSLMLKYFFWMGRLEPRTQWMVILGGWFGNRLLTSLRRTNPELAPLVVPLQVVYLIFVFLTWTADPLANLLLRMDPFGKLVLSREQVQASNWIGATLLLALGFGLAGFFTGSAVLGLAAGVTAFMLIPIAAVFKTPEGWPRRMMTAYAVGMATAASGAGVATLLSSDDGEGGDPLAGIAALLLVVYVIGLVGVGWVGNWLISRRVRR